MNFTYVANQDDLVNLRTRLLPNPCPNNFNFSIIDILYPYLYEILTLYRPISGESFVTINKVSSLFSCHILDSNLKDVKLKFKGGCSMCKKIFNL